MQICTIYWVPSLTISSASRRDRERGVDDKGMKKVFILSRGQGTNKMTRYGIYLSLPPTALLLFSRTSHNPLPHSLLASAFSFLFFLNSYHSDASSSSFTLLTSYTYSFSLHKLSHVNPVTMHFAHFSALLLLAGSAAATPRYPWKGKWENSHRHSSFASLEDVSAGFTMPSGTGTAPVTAQGTVASSKAIASFVPSLSSTESGGDDTGTEAAKAEENPGLPSSSAPAKAVSSTSTAAAVSQPAPTTSASSSSGGGVSYSATFTEYVFLYFRPYHSPHSHLLHYDPPHLIVSSHSFIQGTDSTTAMVPPTATPPPFLADSTTRPGTTRPFRRTYSVRLWARPTLVVPAGNSTQYPTPTLPIPLQRWLG